MLKMPHFLTEAQPKAPDTEMHDLKLKSMSAGARWTVQRHKPKPPPLLPKPLSSSLKSCNTHSMPPRTSGTQGNFNRGASADSLLQGKAPSLPTPGPGPFPAHTI